MDRLSSRHRGLPASSSPLARTILVGGLIVGVLDIADALVVAAVNGTPPGRVLQSIASGVLGRAAYAGGWSSAVLGLVLHFLIAGGVSAVYVAASRLWPTLRRRPWVWGPLYGIVVFLAMYRIVVPMAGLNAWPQRWPALANTVFAHVFAVGLPIALWTRRASGEAATRRRSSGRGSL